MPRRHVLNVCFHGVGTPQRELEAGEGTYWVSTDRLRSILDELAGWPAVRISFDDGNASDAEIALPALAERDLRADFFVVAGRLGEPGSLDEHGVRELRRHGMGIGSHGMRHRSWRGMDPATRDSELVAAREKIAAAVSTAHRQEAFTLCARLVDEVKARLPVWKHQLFTDGTDERVNAP